MHEGTHHLLFKHPLFNYWTGVLCGVPSLASFSAYRVVHLAHHKYEHTDNDPDDAEAVARKYAIPLVIFYYRSLIIGSYMYIFHLAITGFLRAKRSQKMCIVLEYGLIAGVMATAFRFFTPEHIMHIWFYPWVVAAHISNVRGFAEHGLTTGGNPFTATRSITSNPFVRFFLCNVNYHLEHHLFPGVPWWNLPKLRQLLHSEFHQVGASVYPSYTQLLLDFLKTSRRGIIPNTRLVARSMLSEMCR
jgi:fatty acid desaturase